MPHKVSLVPAYFRSFKNAICIGGLMGEKRGGKGGRYLHIEVWKWVLMPLHPYICQNTNVRIAHQLFRK